MPDLGSKRKRQTQSERHETGPAQSRPHEAATYERAAASKQMNHACLFLELVFIGYVFFEIIEAVFPKSYYVNPAEHLSLQSL